MATKKNISIPSLEAFTRIDPNARTNNIQNRDKSNDVSYIVGVAGGHAGVVNIDHPETTKFYATDDQAMSALELLANVVTKRTEAKDMNPTTIYVPVDSHIRAKACFGANKNGTPAVSDKARAYIEKFRSAEYTQRYMNAVNKLMSGIQKMREDKKLLVVREIDEFQFSVVTGVIGLDENKTFLLSGLEVNFEASKENSDIGIARIAKGTVVGKSNPMKLGNDVWVLAEKTYGTHQLTVHNVHGDRKNRKLVAKINETQHPEYAKAQKAYFSLLNAMSPKDAEAEAKDLDVKLSDFTQISSESEIPA